MAATLSDPMLGTEIGRYRLTRLLGEGGMGRVYLGEQLAIGSRVAIKVLSEECSRNPELLERFFAEARAVNLISHENIISVLDMSTLPDGRPFIIMEFIDGHTLAHHVRKQVAPLGGVAQVVGEVLSGLAAAHAIGIVHRDMKPDNVLVTVEGHAKVLDFGIAKLAPGLRAEVSPRTKTGALLGTPAYMAPEQISGAGNVDARTDIYAAGIVLYEAVTGAVPFSGATLFDIMRAHLEQAPPPPSHLRADLPPAFEQVILQALAKDPAHRFQSAQAMAQALQHAASALPPEAWVPLSTRGTPRVAVSGIRQPSSGNGSVPDALKSTAVAPPPTEARRRRTGLVLGIAGAAVVAIGIVAVAISGGGEDTASPPTSEPIAAVAEATPADAAAVAPSPVVEESAPAPDPAPVSTRKAKQPPAPTSAAVASTSPSPPPPPTPPDAGLPPGSGVQLQGVTIITTPAAKSIRQAADYNAKSFDPIAYIPKATALAKKLLPDAALIGFYVTRTFSDGRGVITASAEAQFEFRSRKASALPAGAAPNDAVDRGCKVYVELTPSEVVARIVEDDECNDKIVRAPKCSLASVWKQALAEGAKPDHVAKISWLFDETWYVDTGSGGMASSFPDRCP